MELKEADNTIELESASEERLKAVTQVLEEKLVKRKVSLKAIDYGKVEEATKGRARQKVSIQVGINDDKAREIGKYIKGLGIKGVQHQVQGDQLRVNGKKRDDLQARSRSCASTTSACRSTSRTSATSRSRASAVSVCACWWRRRATRSAVGGCELKRLAKFAFFPVSGLMM